MLVYSFFPARRAFVSAAAALFALVVAASSIVSAQTPQPQTLRLADLYATVQRDNPKIAAARALAVAAASRVPAAYRPADPVVQFGLMNYGVPSLAPMAAVGMAQMQVMQMLPIAGQLRLSGHVAGAQASASEQRARDVAWEVRTDAAMAFYGMYATDHQLATARETLRLLKEIENTAESMYRVGESRQADVLRAQVEIAKMAEDTVRMQAMRSVMVAKLNALLDREPATVVGETALPAFPEELTSQAVLDSTARDDRPTIRAGLDDLAAATASRQLATKAIWPDLQVGAQYAQRGDGAGGTERMGSLMIGASIPIFARDRQLRMRDEAGAMEQMARADLASVRAETRGRIGEAYANLTRARNLARLYRSTVLPQAEATVASAMSSYRVGKVDFMTLLDDQMNVNKYRQELFGLEADEGKAWAELEMLTGRELINSNSTAVVANAGGNQ